MMIMIGPTRLWTLLTLKPDLRLDSRDLSTTSTPSWLLILVFFFRSWVDLLTLYQPFHRGLWGGSQCNPLDGDQCSWQWRNCRWRWGEWMVVVFAVLTWSLVEIWVPHTFLLQSHWRRNSHCTDRWCCSWPDSHHCLQVWCAPIIWNCITQSFSRQPGRIDVEESASGCSQEGIFGRRVDIVSKKCTRDNLIVSPSLFQSEFAAKYGLIGPAAGKPFWTQYSEATDDLLCLSSSCVGFPFPFPIEGLTDLPECQPGAQTSLTPIDV